MNNQPLFQVTNHHGEACGVPPQIDEQTFPGVYRSYFENQNGEQAIFLYDYEQERGTLYMGDAGWEHPHEVMDGKVPGQMLNRSEQLWLSACWEASGALVEVLAPTTELTDRTWKLKIIAPILLSKNMSW